MDNTPGDPVLDTCASLKSLTEASLFSLFFRHDILPRKTFSIYKQAIIDFPLLEKIQKQRYKSMVDSRRLYHGTGDEVHRSSDHHGPSPTRDRCSPPAPESPNSCGSTLPFDVVPAHRGSPPPYDECVSEGQSPRAGSDAVAIFATNPVGDCDLPEYGDTERWDDVLDPLQSVLHCGNDTDIRPTTKRKWSFTTLCTTTTSAMDAPRPGKLQRPLASISNESRVESLHEMQHQQIRLRGQQSEELQKTVEQLQKTVSQLLKAVGELNHTVEVLQEWKRTHENQVGELEETCLQLAERQDDVDDAVGSLSHDVDELGGKHDELGKQMLDVSDEVKDLMEGMLCTTKKEVRKFVDGTIAEEIQVAVVDQVDQLKRKICKALQPT